MNATLSFYECTLSGGDTQKWWGHLNHTHRNGMHLNFLLSEALGTQKHLPLTLVPAGKNLNSYHTIVRGLFYRGL